MNADLEHLIRLQQLYTEADDARRRIDDMPAQSQALEARIEAAGAALEGVRAQLTESQTARRAIEKDLAAIQARLSKYRDQLMEVKTNREYQAMQKEIEVAQHEVAAFEDQVLERMLESDELTASVKRAEAALVAEQAAVTSERAALEKDRRELEKALERNAQDRDPIVAAIAPDALAAFETIARSRKGVAMAEARNGHCTICHVRLRPQVFNEVRRNDSLLRCDSCQRILYFVAVAAAELTPSANTTS